MAVSELREDIVEKTDGADSRYHQFPDWLKARLEWFRDLRFGFFTHWGVYSQWGCIESWPLSAADTWARPDELACWVERGKDLQRFRRDYWQLHRTFNPVRFDPEHWAEVAVAAGMKYAAFTTKHHDGFCMFDTATTDFRVTHPDCPFHRHPKADITRAVFDAFRRRNMGISCYFSKPDWHSPHFWVPDRPAVDRHPNFDTQQEPERWRQFVSFTHEQIRELMSGYGPIDALWLDGGWVRPPTQDIAMDAMVRMARALQPGLIVVDRTVGGVHENIVTPEQKVPDQPLNVPWETCMTAGDSWSYVPGDRYKSAREIIHTLIDVMSKGGNFLLNVGIDPEGRMAPEAESLLREVGRWVHRHAECIFRSRSVEPHRDGGVCFVARGGWTYALLPVDGAGCPARVSWGHHLPGPGGQVHQLGVGLPVPWRVEHDRVTVEPLPDDADPHGDGPARVFRFRRRGV
jgi:alpha-L-fucosidase